MSLGRTEDQQDVFWLVLRAQAEDRGALEELLRATQTRLRPYLAAMIDDPELRSDVMQETLITVFRKLHSLKEPKAYWAWARRVASRCVLSGLTAQRSEAAIVEPEPLEGSEPAVSPAELAGWLPDVLRHLPPATRNVLVLHYCEDLTLQEIGAVLDLPTGTVKSRLAYGLKALRNRPDLYR